MAVTLLLQAESDSLNLLADFPSQKSGQIFLRYSVALGEKFRKRIMGGDCEFFNSLLISRHVGGTIPKHPESHFFCMLTS
jgi:hypothetical protein